MHPQATIDDGLTVLVLSGQFNPELAFVLLLKAKDLQASLRSQILIIVVLSKAHRSFGQFRVLKEGLQVNSALTSQVIGLKEIKVISLHCELIVFVGVSEGE